MRKPDAGNLHVRFDEGEGTRRSLALPFIPCVPLYSTPIRAISVIRGQNFGCGRAALGHPRFNVGDTHTVARSIRNIAHRFRPDDPAQLPLSADMAGTMSS